MIGEIWQFTRIHAQELYRYDSSHSMSPVHDKNKNPLSKEQYSKSLNLTPIVSTRYSNLYYTAIRKNIHSKTT